MEPVKRCIKIDVVSDFVCPWCYVGERRQHMISLFGEERAEMMMSNMGQIGREEGLEMLDKVTQEVA
ncbi:MAG TPA: hypothetical protein ENI05_02995 [Porticoccus sp.]|nr:hypothetical protein [Porticoccus sp.]